MKIVKGGDFGPRLFLLATVVGSRPRILQQSPFVLATRKYLPVGAVRRRHWLCAEWPQMAPFGTENKDVSQAPARVVPKCHARKGSFSWLGGKVAGGGGRGIACGSRISLHMQP